MNERHIEAVSDLLKSISHPIRLKILCLLQDRELSVNELLAEVHTSGANVTQHLNILRQQGIVASRREANMIYNRIGDPRIVEMMGELERLFCRIAMPDAAAGDDAKDAVTDGGATGSMTV